MKKSATATLLCFISLTTFSLIASAEDSHTPWTIDNQSKKEWIGGVGYLNLADELDGESINLGAIVGSLGYKINIHDNFYLIPEVRVGVGIGNDSLYDSYSNDYYKAESTIEVEIDSLVALSVRGQFKFKSGIFLYVAPTYSRGSFSIKTTYKDQYVDEDEPYIEIYNDNDSLDDFTVKAGTGFYLSELTSAELSYEKFEGSEVTTLSIKYNF